MISLTQKNHKKHCILLKATFKIPLFFIIKVYEQTTALNRQLKLNDQQDEAFKKVIYCWAKNNNTAVPALAVEEKKF